MGKKELVKSLTHVYILGWNGIHDLKASVHVIAQHHIAIHHHQLRRGTQPHTGAGLTTVMWTEVGGMHYLVGSDIAVYRPGWYAYLTTTPLPRHVMSCWLRHVPQAKLEES